MNLTAEQRMIAGAPSRARMLVTAGPGTGKTHTLIGRLTALIEEYELAPGSELLVLSFSRAAVREIRDRVQRAQGDVRYIKAHTFDSFSSRLLAEVLPNTDWRNQGYDGRIQTAVEAISKSGDALGHLSSYMHILVDEVQDLVGVRAELVKAILERTVGGPVGWTLFGDPAQGIYNFQLDGEARRIGSAALYKWLRTRFQTGFEERMLTVNHRAQSKAVKSVLPFGPVLNSAAPDYHDISARLRNVFLGLDDFGSLKQGATLAALNEPRPTAILCRNNGQALLLSRRLHEQGILHTCQRRATDRAVSAWIGRLFNDFEGTIIDKDDFLALAQERLSGFNAQESFELLRRTGAAKGKNALDLSILASRIREGSPLDELCEQPRHHLLVSTIHRAKGLEFDRVVVVHDERTSVNVDDPEEETRVLYVALTRPRRWLHRMTMPSYKGFLCKQDEGERWARKLTRYKVNDYEVLGDDAHALDPAGGFALACPVKESQEYIARCVNVHDPLVLSRLDGISKDGAPRVHYAILHDNRPVGITSERFGADMFRTLKLSRNWKVYWPKRIDRVRVESVDTVAGSGLRSEKAGLGKCGFWLRVRAAGLGRFRYSDGE